MGFKLVSLNLNGIRSAANKGWLTWAQNERPDCMGVQEIKAQAGDLTNALRTVAGMPGHFHHAEKKGYSGVGLYARQTPSDVITGIGLPDFDAEGRYVEARWDKPGRRFSVISCYFPSGTSGDERQAVKYRFLEAIFAHLARLKAEREFILIGDVNIAHKEMDLKNWRGNVKNSGFLPDERAWVTKLLDESHGGLVDVYRHLKPDATGEAYTWWSNRGQARANNVGWRIDYHLATPGVAATARDARVYTTERFSDHAPLIVDYDWTL